MIPDRGDKWSKDCNVELCLDIQPTARRQCWRDRAQEEMKSKKKIESRETINGEVVGCFKDKDFY